ncbi:MAG TPA: FCD domain-containing protein, partial [Solirubrobacter sp.]|nr:FCD domain-containing protein [Solirubrobacter sp.]
GPGERYLGPFSDWLQAHRTEVLELLAVRGALDELAVSQAAKQADDETVESIARAHEAFEAAAAEADHDLDALAELDIAFHMAIARASGSVLLEHLLEELNQLFTEARKAVYGIDRRPVGSAREHGEILAAVRAREPVAARDATARHVAATCALLTGTTATDGAS